MFNGKMKALTFSYDDGEIFDMAFPQYLAMGMTYEEYWEKDCSEY